MKRLLDVFYLLAQFALLAISIPKVARLFHAYDSTALGISLGGIDLQSWLGGVIIDGIVGVTTWAALRGFDNTRRIRMLIPAMIVILPCICLSVVANYEDAALKNPAQYANINIFTFPALVLNPLMLSSLPLIVLLLITLVPLVLAAPRIKTAQEIAAETEQEEALIFAGTRLAQARINANAQKRTARFTGYADTLQAVRQRAGNTKGATPADDEVRTQDDINRASPSATTAHMTRAMWNALPLRDRVLRSEIISTKETAEALGISEARARELMKGVRTPDNEHRAVKGRSGVLYTALIESLYAGRSVAAATHAKNLEAALGLNKRTRSLTVVSDTESQEETTEEDAG